MSLELLPGNAAVAGTMGLLAGAVGPEQCWGTPGETGSIFTMAGAEPRQTDGDSTTAGGDEGGRGGRGHQRSDYQNSCASGIQTLTGSVVV